MIRMKDKEANLWARGPIKGCIRPEIRIENLK
jgi:hypothetical protein